MEQKLKFLFLDLKERMNKQIRIKNLTSGVATDQELTDGLASKYDASNPLAFETPTQLTVRDVVNRNRGNHTGTQLASTISDFAASVRGTALSGLNTITVALITASDNVLTALGKLQAQINLAFISQVPEPTGTVNSAGTSTSLARTDHTHNTIINGGSIHGSSEVQTNLTTDSLLAGMTITPPAGVYSIDGMVQSQHQSNSGITHYSFYVGGIKVANSEYSVNRAGSQDGRSPWIQTARVTVNGSQPIDIRWRSQAGVSRSYGRYLKYTRVG